MPNPSVRAGRKGSVERRLAAYAMAGGALTAATADEAKADIIYTPLSVTVSSGGPTTSYTIDAGSTGVVTISATFTPYDSSNPSTTPAAELDATSAAGSSYVVDLFSPAAIPYGTLISGSSDYNFISATKTMATYGASSTSGTWPGVSNAYLGVSFSDPVVAGQTDYGWVEMSVTGTTDPTTPTATATIQGFAYDNAGNPIVAGSLTPVPEPASLATLAMGAAGVGAYLAWRRRRATA